jgi:cap1 methyltransferase
MEEGSPKRRRSRSEDLPTRQSSRDCYDDVVLGMNDGTADTGPRSSWLTSIQWISSNDSQVHLPQSVCTNEPSEDSDSCATLQTEIVCLAQQLVQLKRRLGPASKRCADVVNSFYQHQDCCNTDSGAGATNTTSCHNEFAEARRACNPFEFLGEGMHNGLNDLFMNRSAIKLANIDAALGFCLTAIAATTMQQNDAHQPTSLLLFADLCGAPGGFSEYIMWRCLSSTETQKLPIQCRGYGMSLTGSNEHGQGLGWKLRDTQCCPDDDPWMRLYCQYRICYGEDGTGDIHRWGNVVLLQQMMYQESLPLTENDMERGRVHLVLADGGFDAQRDAENQEQVAQKLVACEAAAALSLLRRGGMLVMKLFGFQTPVIRAVLQHLFIAFEGMTAIKPISSRPASAERYVVCFGFRGNPPDWDGRQWCNQIFLGRPCTLTIPHVAGDYEQLVKHCFRYLDEFDRDLCSLNLKACFSILSYLERKCMKLSQSNYDDQGSYHFDEDMPRINIASYKIAWRLTS